MRNDGPKVAPTRNCLKKDSYEEVVPKTDAASLRLPDDQASSDADTSRDPTDWIASSLRDREVASEVVGRRVGGSKGDDPG